MIIWTSEFETGSPTLDQQHRLLIENTNLLEAQLHITNPTIEQFDFLFNLVDYLESYAANHFKGEEQCMARFHCPSHAANRDDHERFLKYIREYKQRCEREGFRLELLRDLHGTMQTWIREHILKIDTQIKPCIQKVQAE